MVARPSTVYLRVKTLLGVRKQCLVRLSAKSISVEPHFRGLSVHRYGPLLRQYATRNCLSLIRTQDYLAELCSEYCLYERKRGSPKSCGSPRVTWPSAHQMPKLVSMANRRSGSGDFTVPFDIIFAAASCSLHAAEKFPPIW